MSRGQILVITYGASILLGLAVVVLNLFFKQISFFDSLVLALFVQIITAVIETRVHLEHVIAPKFFRDFPDFSTHLNPFSQNVLEILKNSFRAHALENRDLRKALDIYLGEVNRELRDYFVHGKHRVITQPNDRDDYAINMCEKRYRGVSVGAIAAWWESTEGKNVMRYSEEAIARNKNPVTVERVFIVRQRERSKLKSVIQKNLSIGVHVYYADEDKLVTKLKSHDFGIVDDGNAAVEVSYDRHHNSVTETIFYYNSTDQAKDKIREFTDIWDQLESIREKVGKID